MRPDAMTTLSLTDRGFDLVLGGGLTWIERVPGKASATILLLSLIHISEPTRTRRSS